MSNLREELDTYAGEFRHLIASIGSQCDRYEDRVRFIREKKLAYWLPLCPKVVYIADLLHWLSGLMGRASVWSFHLMLFVRQVRLNVQQPNSRGL